MANQTEPVIWVVEDDPSVQRFIADCLRINGFKTVLFGNAEHAYSALSSQPLPALMILDILLPGMTGVDLIRLLKQNSEWEKIPVVVVSVLSRSDSPAREAPETVATAAYWINKPFEATDLIHTVQGILTAVR